MGFDFRKIYAHLDGSTLTYDRFKEEIQQGMRKNLGDLSPEIGWEELYHVMSQMGWITYPDDLSVGGDSTIHFRMGEDRREVRKRKETYKKHFIRTASKRFSRELKNGGVVIPARFNSKEYTEAVRELSKQ